jgi:hypothetical protein
MTPKNAGTEARGVLVKLAGCSAEFQWEIILIHDGQISFCLYTRQIEIGDRYTRQIEIGPRRGQMQEFCSNQPRLRPAAENNRVPEGFFRWEGKKEKEKFEMEKR